MVINGTYQNVGEFTWRVGLSAKSGVDDGIVAIAPHEMATTAWNPELDDVDNPLMDTVVLEQLTK